MPGQEAASRQSSRVERVLDQLDALPPPPAALLAAICSQVNRAFDRPVASAAHPPARWELVGALAKWCEERSTGFDRRSDWWSFWAHGLAVGLMAAGCGSASRAAELFACGLLHDVGRAALALAFPKAHARVCRLADQAEYAAPLDGSGGDGRGVVGGGGGGEGWRRGQIERRIIGLDHAVAGRRLAGRWGVPRAVMQCAWLNDAPADALPERLSSADAVRVVRWADRIVTALGIDAPSMIEPSASEQDWVDVVNGGTGAGDLPAGLTVEQAIDWSRTVAREMSAFFKWRSRIVGRPDKAAEVPEDAETARVTQAGAMPRAELVRALEAARGTVSRQAAQLKAIEAFCKVSSNGQTLRDVCAAAGEALRSVQGLSALVVCCPREDRPCVEYALVGSDSQRGLVDLTELTELLEHCGTGVPPVDHRRDARPTGESNHRRDACATGESLAPHSWAWRPATDGLAGSVVQVLANRFRVSLGPGPMWCLPLDAGGQRVGWALAVGDDLTKRDLGDPNGEAADASVADGREPDSAGRMAALPRVIAAALLQARAEAAAAAMCDELFDMNRVLIDLRETAARSRAVESLASLAAGAAHELNNPLTVISGRAQALLRRIGPAGETDPGIEGRDIADAADGAAEVTAPHAGSRDAQSPAGLQDTLEQIIHQAHAASEMVTRLLEFAEPPAMHIEAIDLTGWLRAAGTKLLKDGLLRPDELSLSAASDTPAVYFDRDLLDRSLGELVDNSLRAMEGRPRRLTVKVGRDCAEDCVVLQVADSGRGMTPDVQARAMDPFFSHGPAGRRTGLGLARVQRWLTAAGGAVRIRSTPNRGTTVELRLPTRQTAPPG